jgi:CheY-like chemotaxis protein
MSRMLIRMGHSVQQAENGKIALDLLTADFNGPKEIDVCFLDNQMPIMSGVEVVDELRKMGSHLFVVGCTGNALREDQVSVLTKSTPADHQDEYLDAGVDKVLTKPIKEKDLKEMVAHARQRLQGLTVPPRVGAPAPSPGI